MTATAKLEPSEVEVRPELTDGFSSRHQCTHAQRPEHELRQGDYEKMSRLTFAKPLCKAAFRVPHVEDSGIGVARAPRTAVSGHPSGIHPDLPAKLSAQVTNKEAGQKSLVKVTDPAAGNENGRTRNPNPQSKVGKKTGGKK